MSILQKLLGPKSKYNKTIPFTYKAKVYAIEGDEETAVVYYADTICGLIDYLEQNSVDPEQVLLFGIYQKKEIAINKEYCLSTSGRWLERPKICQSLEKHYHDTLEEVFKGHTEKQPCLYDDRDRSAN